MANPLPNPPAPVRDWRFDEPDTTNNGDPNLVAYDSVGMLNGSLEAVTRVAPRVPTGAVHLDGSNAACVNFPAQVAQFGTADFTVSFWINTTDKSLDLCDLVGNRLVAGHGNFFCIRMQKSGLVSAEVDQDANGTNYINVVSNASVNNGSWHNVAVVRRSTTLTIYIDGVNPVSATGRGVANLNNGNFLKIGRSANTGDVRFAPVATYDELRIWNVALTADQVLSSLNT